MNSQIFKNQISSKLLFDLLEKICSKTENYYVFNKIAYKKGEFLNLLQPFLDVLLPNYHNSKQFYLINILIPNKLSLPYAPACAMHADRGED